MQNTRPQALREGTSLSLKLTLQKVKKKYPADHEIKLTPKSLPLSFLEVTVSLSLLYVFKLGFILHVTPPNPEMPHLARKKFSQFPNIKEIMPHNHRLIRQHLFSRKTFPEESQQQLEQILACEKSIVSFIFHLSYLFFPPVMGSLFQGPLSA